MGGKAFSYQTPLLRNQLPVGVWEAEPLPIVWIRRETFLFDKAFVRNNIIDDSSCMCMPLSLSLSFHLKYPTGEGRWPESRSAGGFLALQTSFFFLSNCSLLGALAWHLTDVCFLFVFLFFF